MTDQPVKLASEDVIVSAPLSYAGSTQRLVRLRRGKTGSALTAVTIAVVLLLLLAWAFVTCWYLFFGICLVPYRVLRRGSRKRKRQALQHREMLDAIATKTSATAEAARPELPPETAVEEQ